jgi:hypothetical protein
MDNVHQSSYYDVICNSNLVLLLYLIILAVFNPYMYEYLIVVFKCSNLLIIIKLYFRYEFETKWKQCCKSVIICHEGFFPASLLRKLEGILLSELQRLWLGFQL